jgi:hypothetical protein
LNVHFALLLGGPFLIALRHLHATTFAFVVASFASIRFDLNVFTFFLSTVDQEKANLFVVCTGSAFNSSSSAFDFLRRWQRIKFQFVKARRQSVSSEERGKTNDFL